MNLNNSIVNDENNPLAIQHARVLQAVRSAKIVLDHALVAYKEKMDKGSSQSKQKTATTDALWVLHPAVVSVLNILKDVTGDD